MASRVLSGFARPALQQTRCAGYVAAVGCVRSLSFADFVWFRDFGIYSCRFARSYATPAAASASGSNASPAPSASKASDASASPKVSQIVDQISGLSLLEAAELVSTLKVRSNSRYIH